MTQKSSGASSKGKYVKIIVECIKKLIHYLVNRKA